MTTDPYCNHPDCLSGLPCLDLGPDPADYDGQDQHADMVDQLKQEGRELEALRLDDLWHAGDLTAYDALWSLIGAKRHLAEHGPTVLAASDDERDL